MNVNDKQKVRIFVVQLLALYDNTAVRQKIAVENCLVASIGMINVANSCSNFSGLTYLPLVGDQQMMVKLLRVQDIWH